MGSEDLATVHTVHSVLCLQKSKAVESPAKHNHIIASTTAAYEVAGAVLVYYNRYLPYQQTDIG